MRSKLLVSVFIVMAYLAGLFTSHTVIPRVDAQQKPSRFVNVGADGPFRIWRDTRTGPMLHRHNTLLRNALGRPVLK